VSILTFSPPASSNPGSKSVALCAGRKKRALLPTLRVIPEAAKKQDQGHRVKHKIYIFALLGISSQRTFYQLMPSELERKILKINSLRLQNQNKNSQTFKTKNTLLERAQILNNYLRREDL